MTKYKGNEDEFEYNGLHYEAVPATFLCEGCAAFEEFDGLCFEDCDFLPECCSGERDDGCNVIFVQKV